MGLRERLLHQSLVLTPEIRCLVANGTKLGNPSAVGTYFIIYRREENNYDLISSLDDTRVVEAWECCEEETSMLGQWGQLTRELGELYPPPEYSILCGSGRWGPGLLHFMQE